MCAAVTPFKWQSTLRHKYGLVDVNIGDMIFLTLALADHLYEVEVIYDVFKGLFNEFPYITNVVRDCVAARVRACLRACGACGVCGACVAGWLRP